MQRWRRVLVIAGVGVLSATAVPSLLRDHVWGSASYATRKAAGSSPGRSAPCPHWKLLKINVSESMLSPSLPMSLHARRSPSGQAHSEPARGTKDWKITAVKTQSRYCIALRNKFDKTIIGWYDASASNFSSVTGAPLSVNPSEP